MKQRLPPRLLVLSDLPIETSYHGSALLYRLLQDYPRDQLCIAEAGTLVSKPERRIKRVDYRDLRLPFARISRSRFWRWHQAVALRSARLRASMLIPRIQDFAAEAVLTVSHGCSWITAAEIARRLNTPLHLICHDDWSPSDEFDDWKNRIMGEIYRRATSRLCVSPFMVDEYARRYGAGGDVLYPSRGKDAIYYETPPVRLARPNAPFTCAFAGTINSSGIVVLLRRLAKALLTVNGRLLLYGPLSPASARDSGLTASNIELRGMLPSPQLIDVLRSEADTLFVPMSFAEAERSNTRLAFPSKLTDYTAAALPILICGPKDSSVVRWARDYPGVAEVVAEDTDEAIISATNRLAINPGHRLALAERASEVGNKVFSYSAAAELFISKITQENSAFSQIA